MPDFKEAVINIYANQDVRVWLGVAAILLGSFLAVRLGGAAINRLLLPREGTVLAASKRARTLAALLRSILRYTVYFIAGTMILGLFGVQTGTLLAGAGLVGLAVGLGAKNLIQDVITGFFILFEDQFAVGDYISTAGVSGIVEEVGLRVTRLQDLMGQVHYIPNGRIDQVTNYSRKSLKAVVDINILYEEDLGRALEALEQAGRQVAGEFAEVITEGPEVLGLVALNPGRMTVRITAGVRPLNHWKVERELRKRAKESLDAAGIRPPQPVQPG